jgi:hypothetical protein
MEAYALGETHGYSLSKGTPLTEGRGNSFTAAVSQGAPTRKDSQPYQLYAIEDFGGGFGQVAADSVMGGAGQGGQPNRFLDGECWSLLGGKLMPLPARNLVYPTASTSPFPDEIEMPRGVLPVNNAATYTNNLTTFQTLFTAAASMTLSDIYILVKVGDPGNIQLFNVVINPGGYAYQSTAFVTDTGFKWIRVHRISGTGVINSGTQYTLVISNADPTFTIGGFGGLNNALADALQPYAQAFKAGSTTDTFKMWANNIYGAYQLNNAGVYKSIALTSGPTNSGIFNADAAATAERTFAAYTVASAIMFDNKLYATFIGATPRLDMWNPADATAVAVPTSTTTLIALFNMVGLEGSIYGCQGNGTSIYKWDGLYPATNVTQIINPDKIGKSNAGGRNAINALKVYQGHLWVFKPEGVFRIHANPGQIVLTELPRILQIWNAEGLEHQDNGKFVVEHQGTLFFNVRNRLMQIAIGGGGQPVVNEMQPTWGLGRYRSNPYITGLATDGQVLYVSYDNVGVQGWDGRGWHKITDYYTPATTEGGRSGLTYMLNPGQPTDLLWTGDGRQLVKLSLPNIFTRYSTQVYQSDQNKCMTFVSSVLDMDLANVPKFIRSVALYGSSKNWNWKVVGAYYQTGDDPSYRTIVEKAYNEGLARDKWGSPSTGITATSYKVITKLIDAATHLESATASPGIFVPADFQNTYQGSEKRASNDDVDNPVSAVSMAFIIYGWRTDGTVPAASTYLDVAYIEDLVIKYWATLEYLGTWQFTLDLQSVYKNVMAKDQQSLANAQADVLWLRDRIKKQTPTRWTFKWVGGVNITVESPAYSPQWRGEGGVVISDTRWDVARAVSFRLVDTAGA